MPVQRLPRYILLLSEILKFTPTYHIHYQLLLSVVNEMKIITSVINEKKRKEEIKIRGRKLINFLYPLLF